MVPPAPDPTFDVANVGCADTSLPLSLAPGCHPDSAVREALGSSPPPEKLAIPKQHPGL
jgi:hypothetical protein